MWVFFHYKLFDDGRHKENTFVSCYQGTKLYGKLPVIQIGLQVFSNTCLQYRFINMFFLLAAATS
jgi:hypothetical protein